MFNFSEVVIADSHEVQVSMNIANWLVLGKGDPAPEDIDALNKLDELYPLGFEFHVDAYVDTDDEQEVFGPCDLTGHALGTVRARLTPAQMN